MRSIAYRVCQSLCAFNMLVCLSGCATSADPSRMVVGPAEVGQSGGFPEAIEHAMCVRTISGGEETNPLWLSKVGNEEFRSALATSLEQAGLSASASTCKYRVDVNLLGLSQPAFGFDIKVTSHANYKIYDANNNAVLLETISASYDAPFSESVIGTVRLKRANEGAIRASITQFLEKLRAVRPLPSPAPLRSSASRRPPIFSG